MTKLTTEVEIQSADKVMTLIDLLELHRRDLPVELLSSLDDLADCERCEINHYSIREMGFEYAVGYCNEVEVQDIRSVNKILKRVNIGRHIYPDNFKLVANDGTIILEW
jgi:hypothetical protein